MEDSPHLLTAWIKSGSLIECKRSLMKVPCAICYGLTQTTEQGGVSLLVELDTPLDKIFRSNSIMSIT